MSLGRQGSLYFLPISPPPLPPPLPPPIPPPPYLPSSLSPFTFFLPPPLIPPPLIPPPLIPPPLPLVVSLRREGRGSMPLVWSLQRGHTTSHQKLPLIRSKQLTSTVHVGIYILCQCNLLWSVHVLYSYPVCTQCTSLTCSTVL